jgi:hypothetical protein
MARAAAQQAERPAPAAEPTGEKRYPCPMPMRLQVWLARPLRHVVDRGPAEWGMRGRLEYARLETLLEALEEHIAGNVRYCRYTLRELSTFVAWARYVEQKADARGAPVPSTIVPVLARAEYAVGLRATPEVRPGEERRAVDDDAVDGTDPAALFG